MRNITITDMTMRLSGKGFSLSFREKIELVKHLDKLGVDVIEVSPITSPKIDRLLIKSISSAVRDSAVAVSVGLNEENIAIAWGALEEAKKLAADTVQQALDALEVFGDEAKFLRDLVKMLLERNK